MKYYELLKTEVNKRSFQKSVEITNIGTRGHLLSLKLFHDQLIFEMYIYVIITHNHIYNQYALVNST